ncbi:DUF4160 domain-containing protein [Spirosoma arcticum]
MPVIALLDGLKIEMYFNDHAPPHIHAKHAEHEVLITIQEFAVFAGYLPARQLKQVQQYVTTNQEKLLARWKQYNPK